MATAELLVDTDVLIDHLRVYAGWMPTVPSWGSRWSRAVVSSPGCDEPERLRRFLSPMGQLPIDPAIAELVGVTRRDTGIATPDALIAATALAHDPAHDP